MKLDINKILLAQARTGKTMSELGVSRGLIYRIRKGCSVQAITLHKLANALGVDPAELVKDDAKCSR